MPPWSDPIWVGVGIIATLVFGLIGVIAWLKPRSPSRRPAKHETVWVDVSNSIPVFDLPDGTKELGEHLVGVEVHNGSTRPVKVVSWGIKLPGDRKLFVPTPTTHWEPRLPHWVQPGDEAEWFVEAEELRHQQATLGCRFDQMIPYVRLADGRELMSEKAVLLAE